MDGEPEAGGDGPAAIWESDRPRPERAQRPSGPIAESEILIPGVTAPPAPPAGHRHEGSQPDRLPSGPLGGADRPHPRYERGSGDSPPRRGHEAAISPQPANGPLGTDSARATADRSVRRVGSQSADAESLAGNVPDHRRAHGAQPTVPSGTSRFPIAVSSSREGPGESVHHPGTSKSVPKRLDDGQVADVPPAILTPVAVATRLAPVPTRTRAPRVEPAGAEVPDTQPGMPRRSLPARREATPGPATGEARSRSESPQWWTDGQPPAGTPSQPPAAPQIVVVREATPAASVAAFWQRRHLGRLGLRTGILR
jgi:hypothetical protein